MVGKTFAMERGAWSGRSGLCIGIDQRGNPLLLLSVFNRLDPVPVSLSCINMTPTQDVDEFERKVYNPSISKRRSCGR
jgi:hypothetical protein